MARRLFTALSVLSLALFVSTPVLWASCGLRGQHWIYAYDTRGPGGMVSQHNLDLTLSMGFGFKWYVNDWNSWSYRQLTVPCWAVALLSAMLPIHWLLLRRNRLNSGDAAPFCRRCGYNLTGNTSGVCPECGTPTTAEIRA